jgi:hypothetical protein
MNRQEIELLSLLSKMIDEYQGKNEPLYCSLKKIKDDFFYIDINENLLKATGLPTEIIGMNIYNPIFSGTFSDQLYKICEEAWRGKEVFYYVIPSTNKDTFLICVVKPIKNEGKVTEVEGYCAQLNRNDFDQFKGLFVNTWLCERFGSIRGPG